MPFIKSEDLHRRNRCVCGHVNMHHKGFVFGLPQDRQDKSKLTYCIVGGYGSMRCKCKGFATDEFEWEVLKQRAKRNET